ncbi:MAG: PA14 domain-containing protein [Armatimonadota bacterium]|nr:PA14 domain-containing protein [Armatimonadota bacterium]MCX7776794.1 PA14 domain-containing protein [Armatimonadota bacterium]MDW8024590.1 PA14 domain-containing protein [Armatimonadota bacterium]
MQHTPITVASRFAGQPYYSSTFKQRLLIALLAVMHLAPEARVCAAPVGQIFAPVIFSDDFERHGVKTVPSNWEFLRGQWLISRDENNVLKQLQTDMEVAAYAIATWQDYTVVTRLKVMSCSSNWGAGIVAYWHNRHNHYRFYVDGSGMSIVKVEGKKVLPIARADFVMTLRCWYHLKLQVANLEGRVELRGKVWALQSSEPQQWMLVASDTNPSFRNGLAGLWTAGCDAIFGEIIVTSNIEMDNKQAASILFSEDFQSDRKGQAPSSFSLYGGNWIVDKEEGVNGCRQLEDETPISFDENSYAIVRWRDYTITAKLRADKVRTVWGYGIIGYYSHDDSGEHFYRLWYARGVVMLDKRDGEQTFHLGSAPLRIDEGKWCTMQLRLQSYYNGLLIRAKVWGDEPEPREWLLEYFDSKPLHGGQGGVLVFRSECAVDDFKVISNLGTSRIRAVTLQHGVGGYGNYEGTYITNADPKKNFFGTNTLLVTKRGGTVSRALIRFDLSIMPTGSMIKRATLSLYAIRCEDKHTIGVFRLLKRWDKEKVTWLSPDGKVTWSTHGGDFPGDGNNSPRLSFNPASGRGEEATAKVIEAGTWVSFDITNAVRAWVEGKAENNGLLLCIISGSGLVEFDGGKVLRTPKLTIEYELRQPLETIYSPIEYWEAVVRRSLLLGPRRGFHPDGVVGEYYDDEDVETYEIGEPPKASFSKLIFARKDEMIDFRWDVGTSPHPEMGSEFWSVRWQGRMFVPRTDEYVFYLDNLDDAARLYINGKLILDAWKIQMPATHASQPVKLSAGFHDVVVEYHQGPGPGASIRLSFSSHKMPKQTVIFPEGVKGDYYDDPEPQGWKLGEAPPGPFFQRYIFSRVDPAINHDWNTKPHPEMGSRYWGVRWQGQLLVPEDGNYQFFIEDLDDAARLWIDGELIIDEWRIGPQRSVASKPIRLTKGLHEFKLEFYQGPPPVASIRMLWKGPSFEKEVIPPANYFAHYGAE